MAEVSDQHGEPPFANARVLSQRLHPHCVVCGKDNELGLGLEFTIRDDGSVGCCFHCGAAFQGYTDQLHGGVVAMLLDGAMTNCLFAHGHVAATGELKVRYRHPVTARGFAFLSARLDSCPPLRLVSAELVQNGQVKATASAKFMDRCESSEND